MYKLYTTAVDENGNSVNVITYYNISYGGYEPNSVNGSIPNEWEINKIWYGDTRYNSIEDLREFDCDAADEIESTLDDYCNE